MATSSDSDGKESSCSAGDLGSVPGSGRSSGEGHGNPLQYSCLENSMDSPWGCKELNTNLQLTHTHTHTFLMDLPLTASVATSYNTEIEMGVQRSLEARSS